MVYKVRGERTWLRVSAEERRWKSGQILTCALNECLGASPTGHRPRYSSWPLTVWKEVVHSERGHAMWMERNLPKYKGCISWA